MRTLELLDYLVDLARRLGYEIREEWLEGTGGGACVLKGKRIMFVDQSLPPSERVEQLANSLRGNVDLERIYVLPEARGRGLGIWLMECVTAHPDLQGLRRWFLATRDAHRLYAKVGFAPPVYPERMMEYRPASAPTAPGVATNVAHGRRPGAGGT